MHSIKVCDAFYCVDYSSEDMTELKEKTNDAVKEVKSAWKALSSIKSQVQLLQEELEHNQRVGEEMVVILKHIKNGDEEFNIPSNYFSNLLTQFENRLNQYKRRIDEMEEIIINTNQAREQKLKIGQDDGMSGIFQEKLAKFNPLGYEEEQTEASKFALLYQVLQLLYNNF